MFTGRNKFSVEHMYMIDEEYQVESSIVIELETEVIET